MTRVLKYSCFILCIVFCLEGYSQADTLKKEKKLNKKLVYRRARTAAIMSAVIPGAGQIYNGKYWKFPIVYAGLGGFGYLFYINQKQFDYYSTNLRAEYDEDPSTVNATDYDGEALLELKSDARKNRDLGFIGITIIYVLNIIDANVDAHLKTFDVSDDLSLRIKPINTIGILPGNNLSFQTGLSVQFNYKKR
jgi:hypothetical protein